eukprot:CAMPEP_0204587088 /NCGR_PEP_ID=MMETSP0661-20131031/47859_1 /ASSEMBLY_ACC=CAM_ASM_000606 /TAXON_ID=109239 /ORGANISM="Alexandrium margalefi, Strain AMGDE01CS-322" /LENGTH=48 /DNA_ID= /DNA_START= /DNA_END= /DNA_ORIENTATION=
MTSKADGSGIAEAIAHRHCQCRAPTNDHNGKGSKSQAADNPATKHVQT